MATVIVVSDEGMEYRFKDAVRWRYDDAGHLEVESNTDKVIASFRYWESVRMEDDE